MPKLNYRGSESEGWVPLPSGSYAIQVDDVEETRSTNNNPQIKLSGHVVGGPYDAKKITDWFVINDKASWKFTNLLDACGVDFAQEETGEENDKGKPVYDFEVDTDELIGCMYRCDATVDDWEGKKVNRFSNYRSPADDDADETEAAGSNGHAQEEPAEEEQEAAAPPAQPASRRRRRAAP